MADRSLFAFSLYHLKDTDCNGTHFSFVFIRAPITFSFACVCGTRTHCLLLRSERSFSTSLSPRKQVIRISQPQRRIKQNFQKDTRNKNTATIVIMRFGVATASLLWLSTVSSASSFAPVSTGSSPQAVHRWNQRPAFATRGGGGGPDSVSSSSSLAASVEATVVSPMETENWTLLSKRGQDAIQTLIALDQQNGDAAQAHVYGNWPEPGVDDDGKKQLAEQVRKRKRTEPESALHGRKKLSIHSD